ncbi:MAG TPA: histidine phosphatase family protein, partial [Devosia sp.]|nr:histidine phosphatase family protein [Devosia sp.]
MRALYLTHPQVSIDPAVAVPQWGLSELGRERATALAARGVIPARAMVFSSTERKAMELAEIIAPSLAAVVSEHRMGENDRSATGFLPAEKFEATADRFFGEPLMSVDGWERAIDAQSRIVAAVTAAMGRAQPGQLP